MNNLNQMSISASRFFDLKSSSGKLFGDFFSFTKANVVLGSAFLAVAGTSIISVNPVSAVIVNFSVNDGGFTSSGSPAWTYTGTQWQTDGQSDGNNFLTSAIYNVLADGPVNLSVTHAYSFESPANFFDGGLWEASINGDAFSTITPTGGYPVDPNGDGCDTTFGSGVNCWGGISGGFVTNTTSLAGLTAGDTVQIRFQAKWDNSNLEPDPAWQISQVTLDNINDPTAIPFEFNPSFGLVLLGGIFGVQHLRKKMK